jgi:HD-GYP domain-containing protein (c-di-GMP phosphodiesterase class II)
MSAVATVRHNADSPQSGYVPVQVELLKRLHNAAVDLFVQYDCSGPPTLYCRAGYPLEYRQLYSLSDVGVDKVFVRADSFQDFGAHLFESVEADSKREEVPRTERFAALQLAVAVEVERTSRLSDCGPYLTLSQHVGRQLTDLLASSDVLPRDLYRLARHDFNTFAHVTNVAGYSIVLAERMGIRDRHELEQIAAAAMLHDLGKRFIPTRILNKPIRLDPAEREIVETHPQRGYEELCQQKDLSVAQLMMVYQHHERLDGSGYPVGILAEDIHPWAKMLAVVDVFDAMTGTRPYRRSAPMREAFHYLRQRSGTHFDEEVVQCWILAMTSA